MVNNGSLHYDHDRDGTHTELAGCVSSFRKIEREAYLAVRYEMNKLTVNLCEIRLLLKKNSCRIHIFAVAHRLGTGVGGWYKGSMTSCLSGASYWIEK